jgi:DUF971 family protein
MKATRIRQIDRDSLEIQWEDLHMGRVSMTTLRDACPCAGCKGETVLLHTYSPPSPDKSAPARYALRSASAVGGYALKITWADGHDLGLYTWEYLRDMCECEECLKAKGRC